MKITHYQLNLLKKSSRIFPLSAYTVLHIYTHLMFWAGNQSNNQYFDPSLLAKKLTNFHWNEGKKNFKFKKFLKKKPKCPTQNNFFFINQKAIELYSINVGHI